MPAALRTLLAVVATLVPVVPTTSWATTANAQADNVQVDNAVTTTEPVAPTLDAEQVAVLAAAASTPANLLDSERKALRCELGRDNSAACAQAALIQSVLSDVAADRRQDSAAEALDAFYRLVALQQQLTLLDQSDELLGSLLRMAERAEELDLSKGDAFELRQQQLDVQDQRIVARFGVRKLQARLAAAIQWPLEQLEPTALLATPPHDNTDLDQATAVSLALANRGDYRATQTLCRCLTGDSLPAAKSLLGVLQPGLGIHLPKPSTALLMKLAHRNDANSDLACRRRQCSELVQAAGDLVQQQVTQAILSRDEAGQRLLIAREIEQSTIQSTHQKTTAEKIDKAPAGSRDLAKLQELQRQAQRIDRQRDVALADVQLRRAMGTLLSTEPLTTTE